MFSLNKLKSRQEKFDYLVSLPYTARIEKKGEKFYLIIAELSLIAGNNNLEAAYKALNEQKVCLFNRALDCEAEGEIVLPVKIQKTSETKTALKVFFYKILILSFLLGISCLFTGAVLMNKLSNIQFSSIASKASMGLFSEIDKITNATPGVKEIRIKRFRQLLEEMKPYINEYQKAMSPCIEKEKFDDGKKEGKNE